MKTTHAQAIAGVVHGWLLTLASALPLCAIAQIKTDSSLGKAAQTLIGPNYSISQTLGKLAGANLFHSFETFNINTGQSAIFTTDTVGIANVISRVTGGGLTQINGKMQLTAASGAPNFFFINPAGVTFGKGASLDVPGAFHVSTADYVKFPDGNYIADLSRASTFSSAIPQAFGFLGTTRSAITIKDGAALAAKSSQPLSIVGGDVEINNSAFSTQGGAIRVAALGQKALEVDFTGTLPVADGNIAILNGGNIFSSTSSSTYSGSIKMSAGNVAIDGQVGDGLTGLWTFAGFASTGNSGNVDVVATGAISVVNRGSVFSATSSTGNAGWVKLAASSITIDGGTGYSNISSFATSGVGNTGSVDVCATGNLSVVNTGSIYTSTKASGSAGAVNVMAGSITLDGKGYFGKIYSEALSGSTGNAGSVSVSAAGNLSIIDGGLISSTTFSSGNTGSIRVTADSISMDRTESSNVTGIVSLVNSGSNGNASRVDVTVEASRELSLTRGAWITSSSFGKGNAGSIFVKAGSVRIDGQGVSTGILSETLQNGSGDAGNISVISAGDILLTDNGWISSSTVSSGNAGKVSVTAGNLFFDGREPNSQAGIVNVAAEGSSGRAGDIAVTTLGRLSLRNGGTLNSSTLSTGDAGNITIKAGNIDIVEQGKIEINEKFNNYHTGIFTSSSGLGKAGIIDIAASADVSILNTAVISSSALDFGQAGTINVKAANIILDAQDSRYLSGIGSVTTPGSSGDGGYVYIDAREKVVLRNGAQISSSTYSSGKAGSVNVHAANLVIEGSSDTGGSSISAAAQAGSSGHVGAVKIVADESILLVNQGNFSIKNFAKIKDPIQIEEKTLLVDASDIFLSNAQITSASTGNVAASSIQINARDGISLDASSITTSANLGSGGAITVQGGKRMTLNNSQVTTSVLGTSGDGADGGNIHLSAESMIMNTGFIQANTAAKNASGGNVDINVHMLVPSGSSLFVGGQTPYTFQPWVFGFNVIQAAAPTGVSGTVQIATPALDIAGSLMGMNTQAIDTGGLGRSPCQISGGSSLALTGRGGLPASASGLLRKEPGFAPVRAMSTFDKAEQGLVLSNQGCM